MYLGVKRIFKKFILLFFSTVCRDDRPKVVYYHDVGTRHTKMGTPPELFWAHMRYLRNDDVVCFDDGFRGIWDEREHFARAGLHPIVFVAIELVGRPGYLTWDEMRELQRIGFQFESHTCSHQSLTAIKNKEGLRHEIFDAKIELERHLGRFVTGLCFPRGLFNDSIVEMAREAGYQKLYVSYPGVIDPASDIVPRNLVQSMSVGEFRSILHGALLPLQRRYRKMHYQK